MTSRPLISVVSPVYGCRDCLEALVDAVRVAFLDQPLDWELVLVDDRGPDDPWPLITDLAARDARVRGVRLARNHGQHLAIWAGLAATRGDYVAVIDCDLQDDPSIIPSLHRTIVERGHEAVLVDRGSWSDSVFRRAASRFFHEMVRVLAGINIKNLGNFGIYSRRLVDVMLQYKEQEVFLPLIVSVSGLKTSVISHDRSARHAGDTSYNLSRLVRMAIAIIIRYSDRPLKLSVIVGALFSTIAGFVSVVIIVGWLMGAFTVPGWASSILSIWFLSGLILAVLGIHGFYLGRIFAEVNGRPRIIVERETDILPAVGGPGPEEERVPS